MESEYLNKKELLALLRSGDVNKEGVIHMIVDGDYDAFPSESKEDPRLYQRLEALEKQLWPCHKINHDAISDCIERFSREIADLQEKVKALEDQRRETETPVFRLYFEKPRN